LDDGRVFADFTRDILNGGPIILNSDGSAMRSFLYLADATKAFFTVLLKGESAKAYNVANPYTYTSIAHLARRLGVFFNIPVEFREKISDIPKAVEGTGPYDITLLKDLGWNPATMIEEGFARTVESYRC
jgi:nucleoside-diphosphate-sugar epimerase